MDFRNFNRAGVLKKRLRTVTDVPTGHPTSENSPCSPAISLRHNPATSSAGREEISISETEAILGKASPLKPRVFK